jgi:hypothetical protein
MSKPNALVQGTLFLLILKILDLEPRTGLGDFAAATADVERNAAGEPRVALSGASQAGTRGFDSGRVGGIGWGASDKSYSLDEGQPATARVGKGQLDEAFFGDQRYSGIGVTMRWLESVPGFSGLR